MCRPHWPELTVVSIPQSAASSTGSPDTSPVWSTSLTTPLNNPFTFSGDLNSSWAGFIERSELNLTDIIINTFHGIKSVWTCLFTFPRFRELCTAIESYKHWSSAGNLKVRGVLLSYLLSVGQPAFCFTVHNVSPSYCAFYSIVIVLWLCLRIVIAKTLPYSIFKYNLFAGGFQW